MSAVSHRVGVLGPEVSMRGNATAEDCTGASKVRTRPDPASSGTRGAETVAQGQGRVGCQRCVV